MREYGKANIEASTSDTSHATPVANFVSLYLPLAWVDRSRKNIKLNTENVTNLCSGP